MFRKLLLFALGFGLCVQYGLVAQDRDRQENSRRYEDKAHNDAHEWNEHEDQAYRRYLQERHEKYHDFAKAKRREQEEYWNWRHAHPDEDRR